MTLRLILRVCFLALLLPAGGFAHSSGQSRLLDDIIARGDTALAAYEPASSQLTAGHFSALYFNGFETLELELAMRDAQLKGDIEVLFGVLNSHAMRGAEKATVAADWAALRSKLQTARKLYQGSEQADGFSAVFIKALLILLREGAEAMLVVGALAAYLRKAGAADRVWVIHAGVVTAIPLSLLTGWVLLTSLAASGASRGQIEGFTMLTAAAVLIYVSFWMFSKREAQRWQSWIAGQVEGAISRNSLYWLAGAACLAVYREGAETVLFMQALHVASPEQSDALAFGAFSACAALILLYLLMRQASLRLPYSLFFGATAVVLYGMAVVFVGQAILELQAVGLFSSHLLAGFPTVSWLGLAPTAEGVASQLLLMLIPIVLLPFRRKPGSTAQPVS